MQSDRPFKKIRETIFYSKLDNQKDKSAEIYYFYQMSRFGENAIN